MNEVDLTPCERCYTGHDPSAYCPAAEPPLSETRCDYCEKTLRHDKGYCPLFPDVEPPPSYGKLGKKWAKCVCLVHTCYDAAALRRNHYDRR